MSVRRRRKGLNLLFPHSGQHAGYIYAVAAQGNSYQGQNPNRSKGQNHRRQPTIVKQAQPLAIFPSREQMTFIGLLGAGAAGVRLPVCLSQLPGAPELLH